MPKDLQNQITFLKTNGFQAECPQCGGKMDLSKTALFDADNFTPDARLSLPKAEKKYPKTD